MADPVILIISDATVALGDIPAGFPTTPIDPAALTDHKCQVTRAEITSASASTTTDRAATFCAAAATQQVPAASTFALALEGFQDWTATAGISAWLFKNDATEKAFALYLDQEDDPSAVGRIVVVAGAFAGSPQVPLTFAVEMAIQGYPDIKDSAGVSIRAARPVSAVDALSNLARDAGRFRDDWPRRAARLIEDEARQQLMRDTGDGRFSRSTMAAGTVTVAAGSGRADVSARGGVWTWLEEGTRAHTTRAGAGKVVRTPFGPRPEVRVRGVRPRRTWTRTTRTAMPDVERDAQRAFDRMVR